MRPKSEICNPKRDDEHPRPFHMGAPPPRPLMYCGGWECNTWVHHCPIYVKYEEITIYLFFFCILLSESLELTLMSLFRSPKKKLFRDHFLEITFLSSTQLCVTSFPNTEQHFELELSFISFSRRNILILFIKFQDNLSYRQHAVDDGKIHQQSGVNRKWTNKATAMRENQNRRTSSQDATKVNRPL